MIPSILKEAIEEDVLQLNSANDTQLLTDVTECICDLNDELNPRHLDSILYKYPNLTEYQKDALERLFDKFITIKETVDPARIQSFQYDYTEDEELLLYRITDRGITNIILNSDECIAFSFIPKTNGVKDVFFIIDDYEAAALRFFA
ncbi:MAG TPA: hypothetical protein VGB84_02085 [Arachidicoccus sp.]